MIVGGKVEMGTFVKLKVTLENRKKDVFIGQNLEIPTVTIW